MKVIALMFGVWSMDPHYVFSDKRLRTAHHYLVLFTIWCVDPLNVFICGFE